MDIYIVITGFRICLCYGVTLFNLVIRTQYLLYKLTS